jgi:hypothetical protein
VIGSARPADYIWHWAQGRQATRAEIDESIHTGLPLLEAEAGKQEGRMAEPPRQVAAFREFLAAA